MFLLVTKTGVTIRDLTFVFIQSNLVVRPVLGPSFRVFVNREIYTFCDVRCVLFITPKGYTVVHIPITSTPIDFNRVIPVSLRHPHTSIVTEDSNDLPGSMSSRGFVDRILKTPINRGGTGPGGKLLRISVDLV